MVTGIGRAGVCIDENRAFESNGELKCIQRRKGTVCSV